MYYKYKKNVEGREKKSTLNVNLSLNINVFGEVQD